MLKIKNGVIQNNSILGVPFRRAIVSDPGRPNVRPGIALNHILGITNHNTANPGATAANHALWLARVSQEDRQDIGVHFFVDGSEIIQTIPINEATWHAGDGRGPGNMQTIAIEICETEPLAAAEKNAIALNAAFLLTNPQWRIFKHQDWSGKFCPRRILSRPDGWNTFVAAIQKRVQTEKKAAKPAAQDNKPSAWAEEALRWAMARRLIVGTPDGNLHLKRPVSREELLVFLHRLSGEQR